MSFDLIDSCIPLIMTAVEVYDVDEMEHLNVLLLNVMTVLSFRPNEAVVLPSCSITTAFPLTINVDCVMEIELFEMRI